MVERIKLSKQVSIYFDDERKTIARFPTNSNLLVNKSDNSIYFGIYGIEPINSVLCKLFDTDDLNKINGSVFVMDCLGEDVNVTFNINAEGQLQFKFSKNGMLNSLADKYMVEKMDSFDFTKMLLVFDFINNKIRFKDPNELLL